MVKDNEPTANGATINVESFGKGDKMTGCYAAIDMTGTNGYKRYKSVFFKD